MIEISAEEFLRSRITELRIQKNVSEHKMSLDLDKGSSYIRAITSGTALPSTRELFRIIDYLGLTPAEFFMPLSEGTNSYSKICEQLRTMDEDDLEKVAMFIQWITQ